MSVLNGLRVLLAEDEAVVLLMTRAMLEDFGCEVVAECWGVEGALDALEKEQIDLAIMDIKLRGDVSYPAADHMRKLGIPFVFATALHPAPSYADVPLVRKPFLSKDLKLAILGAMERSGTAMQSMAS